MMYRVVFNDLRHLDEERVSEGILDMWEDSLFAAITGFLVGVTFSST